MADASPLVSRELRAAADRLTGRRVVCSRQSVCGTGTSGMGVLRRMLRADLEAGAADRAFGTGWFSGVVGLALALALHLLPAGRQVAERLRRRRASGAGRLSAAAGLSVSGRPTIAASDPTCASSNDALHHSFCDRAHRSRCPICYPAVRVGVARRCDAQLSGAVVSSRSAARAR